MDDHVYTISELAAIHEISRQTLIYYDKIGLFRPAYQNEKGYRFYTLEQCPLLREIRLLVTLNVPLNEIDDYLHHKDLERGIELLSEQLSETGRKIRELRQIEKILKLRLDNFKKVSKEQNFGELQLGGRPVRYYVRLPYPSKPDIDEVSLLFRKIMGNFRSGVKRKEFARYYNELQFKHGQLLLNKENLKKEDIFEHCGAVIYSNETISNKVLQNSEHGELIRSFPKGLYASTLYSGSLEESEQAVRTFVAKAEHMGFEISGDILFTAILEQPFIMDKTRQTYEIEALCTEISENFVL